ncbi:MAG: hypothetical protein HZA51_14840 [Planctomycetes bacterium]|nr:hypothetical protein [Planctomycetota bacterium]
MSETNDFYVGYLRMPTGLNRFIRWTAPMLIAAALATAWSLSRSQNNPGDGVWHDDAESLVGRLSTYPYPHIRILSTQHGDAVQSIETVLLVSEGKHGGGERVAGLDGRIARVRGTILERDGRRLLELSETDAAKAEDATPSPDAARLAAPHVVAMGSVTLQGEIIDPKCYSGAMKPGEGKAHKECATLCIAGGIPPMFVTRNAAGKRNYYLLTDPNGRALDDRILPFVADAVQVTGELERRDDLLVLRINPADIRRL